MKKISLEKFEKKYNPIRNLYRNVSDSKYNGFYFGMEQKEFRAVLHATASCEIWTLFEEDNIVKIKPVFDEKFEPDRNVVVVGYFITRNFEQNKNEMELVY